MPDRKFNFCTKFAIKTLADIGSLKSLHTFLKKCLYHRPMPVKFEQNRMVQTTRNFELFDKKPVFFITIFDKELTPFWKTFLQLKLFSNAKLSNLLTIIF